MVVAVVYFVFSPESSQNYFPPCPFHLATGLDCPGCGSQRAIHHLLHLDIRLAFLRNPLLVIAIPYILLGLYFEYYGGKERFPHIRQTFFGKKATIAVFIIIMAYWIGRNIVKYL